MRSAKSTSALLVVAAFLELALATEGYTQSLDVSGRTQASNSSTFAVPSQSSPPATARLSTSTSHWDGGGRSSTTSTSEGLDEFEPQQLLPDPSSSILSTSGTGQTLSESVSLTTGSSQYPDLSSLPSLSSSSSSWDSTELALDSASSSSVSASIAISSSAEDIPSSTVPETTMKPSLSTTILDRSTPPPSLTLVTLTLSDPPTKPSGEAKATEEPPLDCIPPKEEDKHTTISVVYTATTTFFGDPAEYVPPYPELTTPKLCPGTGNPEFGSGPGDLDGGDMTDSYVSTICYTEKDEKTCKTVTVEAPMATSEKSKSAWVRETVTFVTTDKNPSVVYNPIKTPGYGKETYTDNDGIHHTKQPPLQTRLPQSPASNPTHKLTIEPTKVIIDSKTITVHPTETTRVTVDDRVFTINPTEVIGDGSTIRRPWNGQASRGPVLPLTTTLGSTPVVIAPSGRRSVVVIGDSTLTIPSGGTTAVIDGATVTLGPTAIHFPNHVVPLDHEAQMLTEVFVEGGQMITAIGPTLLVIDGTTITYGKKTPAIVRTVDDEVITVGPSGVVVGSKTLGGPNAARQDTDIRIVGGATLTQIGESILVIAGTTFTVGPGGDGPLTTNIGGERITIGPDGVSFSTLSLAYPFGPTIITTMAAEPTKTGSSLPAETEDDDNAGSALGGSLLTTILLCIAVGVWNLGTIY